MRLVPAGLATPPEPKEVPASGVCSNGHPVGLGGGGEAPRTRGFCGQCGEPFDLIRSRTKQIIAKRYEVYEYLGEGATGTALLAYDTRLGADVVLKDLSKSPDPNARPERDALVGLRHDSIVQIYGYEPRGTNILLHDEDGEQVEKPFRSGPYLVLEYVRGTPLSLDAEGDLPVILGHGLQMLRALDHLHAWGLIHMDVKPANIIRFWERSPEGPRDRVRLIDFGAARTTAARGPAREYTPDFAPLPGDPERAQPTPGFDLYGLGKTLDDLCRPYDVHGSSATPAVRALGMLIERATDDTQPQHRFATARDFAEQLSGVVRLVVTESGRVRGISRPSAVFGPIAEPLHGGLGTERPVDHWIAGPMAKAGGFPLPEPFLPPPAEDIATALPAPLAVPAVPRGGDRHLNALRGSLRAADRQGARLALELSALPPWSWGHRWYTALIALVSGDYAAAAAAFGEVRAALPGELPPLIAVGLCAENLGDLETAESCYRMVSAADPLSAPAAFGLARVLLWGGHRDSARTAARLFTRELRAGQFRLEQEAQVAEIRLLAAVTAGQTPTAANLNSAQSRLDESRLPDRVRAGLTAEIQYARARARGDWAALSEPVRALSVFTSGTQFVKIVDRANELRPPVRWWPFTGRREREHADA